MSTASKIAYNTFWQIIGRSLSLVFSLISLGLITRYLGQIGFGNYTTIFVFLQISSIIADFGLTLMAVQLISEITSKDKLIIQEKTNNIFNNIFTLRLFLSILLLGLASIIIWFFPYPSIVKYGVFISSFSFLFLSLSTILQSLFQKNLQMIKPTIAEIANKAIFLIGVCLVTVYNLQLYGILIFLVFSSLVNLILMLYWSSHLVKIKLLVEWPVWLYVLKKSWPISISIIFNLIYLKADILILSFYFEQNIVGLYGAAYRAIDVLAVFPYLFIGMILPLLSSAWANKNHEQFKKLIQNSFDALSIITIPMVVGIIFLAKPIMSLIAGSDFNDSGDILQVLVIGLGMLYLGTIFTHAIIAIDKQKKMMWGFLFTAITSLIGYLILIPKYSVWGAVVITVYSEGLVAIIALIIVIKTIKFYPNFIILLKSIIASTIMGLFLYLTTDWNMLINIIIAIIVYFSIMLLIKGVNKNLIQEILIKNPKQ